MTTKKQMLSRIETLESMVIKLVAAKDSFQHTCLACKHYSTADLGASGKTRYCSLYANAMCQEFSPAEKNQKASEGSPT